MSKIVNAYASDSAGAPFQPFSYEIDTLQPGEVIIKVDYCGLCYSDVSMWQNDWGRTSYPFVPGHEVVGTIVQVGDNVKGVTVNDKVGLGWLSKACLHCDYCMDGAQNLCEHPEETIVNRHGGFADYVKAHWSWTIPLPTDLEIKKAGPLFCGGITVFRPLVMAEVQPTDRVGVIGIGGLGHLAVQFLNKWGCEVTAFTSSTDKEQELKELGAHHIIHSTNEEELKQVTGSYDFILNTTNANLNWQLFINALKPQGKFHTVGASPKPMEFSAFSLIGGEKSISGSPLGSIALIRKMLEFCIRHSIYPIVEEFKMSDINEAFQHLKDGKARYRVVLKAGE